MKLNNNALQELYDAVVNGTITISPHAESPIDKAFRECDEKIQKDNDFWKCGNEILHSANMDLVNYKKKLEKEIENLQSRAHYAEDEVERLRKAHDELFNAGSRKISELRRENEAVNKKLEKEIEELKKKIQSLDDDLKSKACSRDAWRTEAERLRKKLTESYSNGYSDGKEEGEENLWDMLQNVNDSQPYDFDAECDGMEDVISMDLEDFLDTYRKWQEEKKKVAEEAKKKHIEYMRGYLKRYCIGRLCTNCLLHDAYKPVTSCMFSKLTDEEVEKRYRKVISARPPQSLECTIEATVEINKDLLEKVCGIKPEEEEHKLEYGDAVRVPWRDYDYMYIGPDKRGDGKMIRLFNPKHHNVAYVSSNEYLDIRGYKIIIGNEEDLRKIFGLDRFCVRRHSWK